MKDLYLQKYLTILFVLFYFQLTTAQCVVVPDQNTVYGTAFTDSDQNGIFDVTETGITGIDVDLYQDFNGNGIVDVGDIIVDSATTDLLGNYALVPPEIIFEEDVLDRFNYRSYGNNNGSQDWEDDWEEIGESDGPYFGNVEVTNALRFGRNSYFDAVITGDGAYRVANLDTYTSATLSFRFRDYISFPSAQYFSVDAEVSADGVTYTTLGTFNFGDPTQTHTYDITAFISATTHIRFVANGIIENNRSNYLYFDNVGIDYSKEGYFPTYVAAIDDASIPVGTSLTTPTYSAITFTDIGEISCDHNFGFFACALTCAPDAVDDSATLDQGGSITMDVLSNDVEGNDNIDPMSVTIVSQPNFGTATVAPTGEIIYAPNGNYFGTDSFVYQVCDDNGFNPLCDTATVYINDYRKPDRCLSFSC